MPAPSQASVSTVPERNPKRLYEEDDSGDDEDAAEQHTAGRITEELVAAFDRMTSGRSQEWDASDAWAEEQQHCTRDETTARRLGLRRLILFCPHPLRAWHEARQSSDSQSVNEKFSEPLAVVVTSVVSVRGATVFRSADGTQS